MKTVHFIYVLPPSGNLIGKVFRRVFRREMSRMGSVASFKWPNPLRAPHSITFFLGQSLETRYKVKLYDLREHLTICPAQGDILLGHLWTDRNTVIWNSIDDSRFSKKILIQPYNNDELQLGWVREGLKFCDGLIAIGGDYWVDNFTESPLKDFSEKIFHLNMAVDASSYPIVKKEFNPPNKRRFLYIGRQSKFRDEKGIKLLEELAKLIPNFQGGYICVGAEIKGWKKISEPIALTPDFMKMIANHYDVFINMSRADAQVTTILEAMSWGFPVACTNESGYSRERNIFYLSLKDMNHNVDLVHKIQNLSDDEIKSISVENRLVVDNKYSWDVFVLNFEEFMRRIL